MCSDVTDVKDPVVRVATMWIKKKWRIEREITNVSFLHECMSGKNNEITM
jgi:hypothetical protein